MKKYFIYLMMALAVVTFNACGDDDPIQNEPETEQPETPDDSDDPDNPDNPGESDDPAPPMTRILRMNLRTKAIS